MPLLRFGVLVVIFGFSFLTLIVGGASAFAADDPKVSAGDTAWVLTSSALVLLMTAPGLALVAKDAGALIGTLRLWQIRAGDVPALLLGPLAVAKAYRSRGLGRRLMGDALFRATAARHRAILLVGDAPYYEPFGFARRHTLKLALPGPVDEERFLGLELKKGALKGAKGLVTPAGARDLPVHRGTWELRRAA